MSKVVLIKAILKSLDTVVDDASNGFVFESDDAANFDDINAVFLHVQRFYNVHGTGGTNPIAEYISKVMSFGTNASELEAYDLDGHLNGSPHGSPIAIANWTLGGDNTSIGLPEQCAATISFRSDYGTDVEFGPHTRPRARDRNRLYIGPLNTATLDHLTSGRCVLKASVITDMLAALFDLSGTVVGSTPSHWNLRQWSRVNASVKLPTVGWMDDRFDTQRRRADPAPGSRTYIPLESV